MHPLTAIRYCSWVLWPALATVVFWLTFGACVDAPAADTGPQARIVAEWDPLACRDPHRVVVELEDDGGEPVRASAPCALGGLTLDLPHLGVWHGRIYAWVLGEAARASSNVELTVDQAIVRWRLDPP